MTCRPIGSGASVMSCMYVIIVHVAYVTLIKKLLTYLLTVIDLKVEVDLSK